MSRARDTADQINRINSSAADATAITVDSSENVLVGLTATEAVGTNAGTQLRADGLVYAAVTSDAHILSRRSSNGVILNFRKDTTTVGSIALDPSNIGIGSGDTGIFFNSGDDALIPVGTGGNLLSSRDNAIDLGRTNARFKDAYIGGGVYLGGTGSANKLEDYEEGGWTPGAKGASSSNVATVASATAGSYVKIGNQVTVNFIVVISSLGSATGPLQITGLPFTVAAPLTSTGIQANGTAGYWAGFATSINNLVFTAEGNTNLMYAYGTTSGTQTSLSNITIAQMGTAALRGSISYRTT